MRIPILAFGAFASIITTVALANTVVTSQTYVDTQDALKQDKIPAGTTGQIVLYNGTDANGQTKFTGRQIATTLNANNDIPTSGAVLNYLNNTYHTINRDEMNDGPLSKMGLGNDELYLIPDELVNGNETAINFMRSEADNTTLTTGAVVYGLNKLAKAKQDVLPATSGEFAPDYGTVIGTTSKAGTIREIPYFLANIGMQPINRAAVEYENNRFQYGEKPLVLVDDLTMQATLDDLLPEVTLTKKVNNKQLPLNVLVGFPDTNEEAANKYMKRIPFVTPEYIQESFSTSLTYMNSEQARRLLQNNFGKLNDDLENLKGIAIDGLTLQEFLASFLGYMPDPTLPTGTAGNVVTYDENGAIGGSRAIYDGSATYNATNDATKLVTANGVSKMKECTRWADNAEHTDANCLLWRLP